MEAEIIKRHIPHLVTAISDVVQPVSDQCLAKGLIPDSVYKRVLESGETSEDKARTLILAVRRSTERDATRCFELFLNILKEKLPFGSGDPLLRKIREEYESGNMCQDVISASSNKQLLQSTDSLEQISSQRMPLLDKLVESIRLHERACTEKILLQEQLKSKSEENKSLKEELQGLQSKTQEETDMISFTSQRVSECEVEMVKLKERIEAVESTIEDQGMRVKRGTSVIDVKMKEFLLAVKQETTTLKNNLEENNYKLKDKDKEMLAIQRKHEKERDELKLRVKDLEHKVALQQKDIEMKNIELKYERSKTEQQKHPASPKHSPTSSIDLGYMMVDEDDDGYQFDDLAIDDD